MGALQDNPIWIVWKKAGRDHRAEFVTALAQFYNRLLCFALQKIGKCQRGDKCYPS